MGSRPLARRCLSHMEFSAHWKAFSSAVGLEPGPRRGGRDSSAKTTWIQEKTNNSLSSSWLPKFVPGFLEARLLVWVPGSGSSHFVTSPAPVWPGSWLCSWQPLPYVPNCSRTPRANNCSTWPGGKGKDGTGAWGAWTRVGTHKSPSVAAAGGALLPGEVQSSALRTQTHLWTLLG